MVAKNQYVFEPDYAIPPGWTLREVMDSRGMTQAELAKRAGLSVQTLNRIFNGEQPISHETANRLELVTGVPATFWNNYESMYRHQLARIEERKRLEADVEWLKTIPVRELQKRELVPTTQDKTMLLRDVLSFYGVSSVEAWWNVWESPAVAARRSKCFESLPGPASAWIRQGELRALEIECEPYDRRRFQQALQTIRGTTREEPPVAGPEMIRLCAEAGVAVALVPSMPKVPWNGATRWLTPSKAMLLLSHRGKAEDRFWFSFYHEAGHILNGSKRQLIIDDGTSENDEEKKADAFASELLIPARHHGEILSARSEADVREIAVQLGVSPGIVAGRYQYLTKRWAAFKGLVRPFDWAP